jgi:hypothetical protein
VEAGIKAGGEGPTDDLRLNRSITAATVEEVSGFAFPSGHATAAVAVWGRIPPGGTLTNEPIELGLQLRDAPGLRLLEWVPLHGLVQEVSVDQLPRADGALVGDHRIGHADLSEHVGEDRALTRRVCSPWGPA